MPDLTYILADKPYTRKALRALREQHRRSCGGTSKLVAKGGRLTITFTERSMVVGAVEEMVRAEFQREDLERRVADLEGMLVERAQSQRPRR